MSCISFFFSIIPLREKTGNYDFNPRRQDRADIIPLREKTGNYDALMALSAIITIIPLREKTGNYDEIPLRSPTAQNYTTTRENRELRLRGSSRIPRYNYTTTRENRELRHAKDIPDRTEDYTTTRENWELRLMLLNLTRIVESVLASSEDSVEQEITASGTGV